MINKGQNNAESKFNSRRDSDQQEINEGIKDQPNPNENRKRMSIKNVANHIVHKIVVCSHDIGNIDNPKNSIHSPREMASPRSDTGMGNKANFGKNNIKKQISKDNNDLLINRNDQGTNNDGKEKIGIKTNNILPNSSSEGSIQNNIKKTKSDGFESEDPESNRKNN